MNRNISNYILKLEKFIDKDICKNTIKELKKVPFETHKFYNSLTGEEKPISGKQELEVGINEYADKILTNYIIMNKIKQSLEIYIGHYLNMPWFNSINGYTPVRFNKYKKTRKMALHCDHIHSIFDGQRKGVPILSILGLLNDDFKGGEFVMFDNFKMDFKEGDIIIFPSNFIYPHKVEPVTKGTRYSFISWAW